MTPEELMALSASLAERSARLGWGGPFGAVIAKDGEVIASASNTVLLTGDITAHAEVQAIRKAVQVLNPYAPSISEVQQDDSTLTLIPREPGSPDPMPERAQMLAGYEIYASGFPCPMCMGAIYWARISTLYYACSVEQTREIGFDDAFQYEDFAKPLDERRIPIHRIGEDAGLTAYRAWQEKADKHPY